MISGRPCGRCWATYAFIDGKDTACGESDVLAVGRPAPFNQCRSALPPRRRAAHQWRCCGHVYTRVAHAPRWSALPAPMVVLPKSASKTVRMEAAVAGSLEVSCSAPWRRLYKLAAKTFRHPKMTDHSCHWTATDWPTSHTIVLAAPGIPPPSPIPPSSLPSLTLPRPP